MDRLQSASSPNDKLREGLDVFQDAAMARGADPRLLERLVEISEVVGEDLAWVQEALLTVSNSGTAPATDAARHLVERGGKRVRPLALLLSSACFGPVPSQARELALVAELVHSATLLHDDVADEGQERRGAPTSRKLYGNAVSVLAGDLLLVQALERTSTIAPTLLPSLLTTLHRLVDGEIIQLRGRTTLDVSEVTYQRIVQGKTASLFGWCSATGARLGGATPEQTASLERFGEDVGQAFQLVDDLLDYSGKATGKTSLSDLREGKLTLPLVLAVERCPELLTGLTAIHGGDLSGIEEIGRRVVASGACDIVRSRAIAVTERAVSSLSGVAPSPARALLENVALELAGRAR